MVTTYASHNTPIYMFGGMSDDTPSSELWELTPGTLMWLQIRVEGVTEYGLATLYYLQCFFFWASSFTLLQCVHLLILPNNNAVRPRYHHTAAVVGNRLLMYGGIVDGKPSVRTYSCKRGVSLCSSCRAIFFSLATRTYGQLSSSRGTLA